MDPVPFEELSSLGMFAPLKLFKLGNPESRRENTNIYSISLAETFHSGGVDDATFFGTNDFKIVARAQCSCSITGKTMNYFIRKE